MKAFFIGGLCLMLCIVPRPSAAQQRPAAPQLITEAGVTRLLVGGRLFVMLGGELGNSNASSLDVAKPIFTKLAAMNLNTVLVPVYWELVEPEESKWAFDLIGQVIRAARRDRLRVVLLWFGTWKNSMSSYVPAWVKNNQQRFPRAAVKGGRSVEALSAFSDASRDADARAFAALMRYVRGIDERQQTVVMVQVENEVGMIDEAADRSPAAAAAFRAPVPRELTEYLAAHRASLDPTLAKAWQQSGNKPSGTWEEVFGRGVATEELFSAWHFARYVDAVARAGKAAYPLPLFVNAALNRPGRTPGQYPSGGPLPHLYDVWKAGAPTIDFLAPDIYLPNFEQWFERYRRPGNALFVPEAKNGLDASVNALYAVGSGAIGFSPFSIENSDEPTRAALTRTYALLDQLAPALQAAKEKTAGVLLEKERPTTKLQFGDTTFTVAHDYTFEWASPARHDPVWPRGGGLVVALGPDEFVVAGNGIIVTFAATSPTDPRGPLVGIERIDEGRFEKGRFVPTRRLNGDETHQGRHLRLSMGELGLQRVKLYRYR